MSFVFTPRVALYSLSEEGVAPEAYRDGKGVWTWAGGLTDAAGVDVLSYRDNPRPLGECLRATIARMQALYLPPIARAFSGHLLLEHELAAALSFEWRNGSIERATWVRDWCAGNEAAARLDFMNWTDHGAEKDRCTRERDLFFDAKWPSLKVPVWRVAKPSYKPVRPVPTDLMPIVQQILGGR